MGANNVFGKFAGDECLDEGGAATAGQFLDKIAFWTKVAADGAAATATADTFVFTNLTGGSIMLLAPSFVCIGAGITADNTNFATLQVKRDDGIGGASVVAWSITTAITDSGNVTASIPKVFTLRSATANNVIVPAGANVLVAITKSGAGVVVPLGGITIPYRMVG